MKNLLLYSRADGRFSKENAVMADIQVANALDLGYRPEDILVFTNFPYEHLGVRSTVIPDLSYKEDRTNKIPMIVYLFDQELIEEGETYWYHDFDAYQNEPFDIDLAAMGLDLALVGYGYRDYWNCGSFFFRKSAEDIFRLWNESIVPTNRADEKAILKLIREGKIDSKRYTTLNLTYNFGQKIPEDAEVYPTVEQPLKVLHFHPYYRYRSWKPMNIHVFMYGDNPHHKPMMSARLIRVFKEHGIS